MVNEINIIVERGEIFGILGPNGAGKTTTLKMITADLHPDKGKVGIQTFFSFLFVVFGFFVNRNSNKTFYFLNLI